jgi:hypothetical protein
MGNNQTIFTEEEVENYLVCTFFVYENNCCFNIIYYLQILPWVFVALSSQVSDKLCMIT